MGREIRCNRCGVPHAEHPDANKHGGVGRYFEWRDGICGVCRDRIREWEAKARPYLISRRLNQHREKCGRLNQQLSDYHEA